MDNPDLEQSAAVTLESVSDAFFAINHTYVNSVAERMVRLRRDQVLGQMVCRVFPQRELRPDGVDAERPSRVVFRLPAQPDQRRGR